MRKWPQSIWTRSTWSDCKLISDNKVICLVRNKYLKMIVNWRNKMLFIGFKGIEERKYQNYWKS